ncbi:MAG: Leucyl aminopeptidase [Gammaproteobacteria bacterium]|nr:Leucyl aminopeptidase [Gammaproteobacteria bacterium]
MHYELCNSLADSVDAELYVLAAAEDCRLLNPLSPTLANNIKKTLQNDGFKCDAGNLCWLQEKDEKHDHRLLIVGCGTEKALSPAQYTRMISMALCAVSKTAAKRVYIGLTAAAVTDKNPEWLLSQFVQKQAALYYRYQGTPRQKNKEPPQQNTFILGTAQAADLHKTLMQAQALAAGMNYTRDLANLPPNICNPTYLAKEAQALAKTSPHIKTTILDESDMEKLKMGSLLAVSAGSKEPAKLIIMEYRNGAKTEKPVVLVGKGITFDTGGLSLKAPGAMISMKYDMAGGAAVFGAIKAASQLQLPINLVGIIAAVENMPSGEATRPEDVVTSLSGQTIEILNTDAEGRLVLCDAITYAKRFEPDVVIDIATLTGAIITALGHEASGLMSNDQTLANELLAAGDAAYDRAWQLPIWEEYQPMLDTPFADMKNINESIAAKSIFAGCFLARFADGLRWAHLDVAGTAIPPKREDGATGRPVPLLLQYLIDRVKQKG